MDTTSSTPQSAASTPTSRGSAGVRSSGGGGAAGVAGVAGAAGAAGAIDRAATDSRGTAPLAIEARGLSKCFGDQEVLSDIDLRIGAGESIAIMGPSGSGKSTLLHCLSGVLEASRGQILLGGHELTQLSDKQRSHLRLAHCGFVFQDGQLIPELSLRENVALPLMLNGISRGKALKQADNTLNKLGLGQLVKRRPGQISGGQGQRVAIARALAGHPAIIFADEPTGALDSTTGHEAMQLLTSVSKMANSAFVLVTHDRKMADWCDRIVEIRDGIIHADYQLEQSNSAQGVSR